MGMFDYFYPEPAIGCHRPGCAGKLIAWQGKHRGNCLFSWKQGELAPLDQSASEDCKLDPARLSAIRLPANENIPAGWAHCDRCNADAPFSIECITDGDGRWKSVKVVGPTTGGRVLDDGWIQCAACFDAWPGVEGKQSYVCPSCKRFVLMQENSLSS
jgi:hypothetical protein